MSLTKLDTHFYDGKIQESYTELVKFIGAHSDFPLFITSKIFVENEFVHWARTFISGIHLIPNSDKYPRAAEAVELMIQDRKGNFDRTDKVDSELLFMYIIMKGRIPNLEYFLEQLQDIVVSGPCPQGRAKRLLSVALSIAIFQK